MQNIFPNVFSECCRLGCHRNRKTLRPTLLPHVRSFVFMNSSWRHGKIASWLVRYENLFYTPQSTPHAKLYSVPGAFFVPALTIVFSPTVWLVFILRSESVYFGSGLVFFLFSRALCTCVFRFVTAPRVCGFVLAFRVFTLLCREENFVNLIHAPLKNPRPGEKVFPFSERSGKVLFDCRVGIKWNMFGLPKGGKEVSLSV